MLSRAWTRLIHQMLVRRKVETQTNLSGLQDKKPRNKRHRKCSCHSSTKYSAMARSRQQLLEYLSRPRKVSCYMFSRPHSKFSFFPVSMFVLSDLLQSSKSINLSKTVSEFVDSRKTKMKCQFNPAEQPYRWGSETELLQIHLWLFTTFTELLLP